MKIQTIIIAFFFSMLSLLFTKETYSWPDTGQKESYPAFGSQGKISNAQSHKNDNIHWGLAHLTYMIGTSNIQQFK